MGSFAHCPGSTLLRYVLTCLSRNSQKRVPFSEWGSDLSRSGERVSFLVDLGNKGTFFMTIFIVWSHFDIFLERYSSCNVHLRVFMLLFRDKGIILNLILVIYHVQIFGLVVHLWAKGVFGRGRLRKGYDFSIKNFRDMAAFQNCPDTHVNIAFYQSEPPGARMHRFLSGLDWSIWHGGNKLIHLFLFATNYTQMRYMYYCHDR